MNNTPRCNNNIKIGHWNANGLVNKWNELKDFIFKYKLDVMLINESKAPTSRSFKLNGYSIYKKERQGKNPGGGLLIIISEKIKHSELSNDFDFQTIETLGIKLNNELTLYSIYVRPTVGKVKNVIDDKELQTLINSANKVILIGDFNAKHNNWNCKTNNRNGRIIFNYVNNNPVAVIAPDRYTLYPSNGGQASVVDFSIIKNMNTHIPIETIDELDSDHMPITLTISNTTNYRHDERYYLDYKKTDWPLFRTHINDNLTINKHIQTKKDVDSEIDNLTKIINEAKNIAIPKQKHKTYMQELPSHIQQIIRDRNMYRRKYQRHRVDADKQLFVSLAKT